MAFEVVLASRTERFRRVAVGRSGAVLHATVQCLTAT
jgi:hypothetical protein